MKNAIAKVVLASILPTVALTVIHAAVPSTATQNVPGKMNYQGYLRDPSTGNAYADGIYTLDCRIYSNDMGGTPLWGGRYSAYVKDGYFNIMLGDENATQNLDDMSGITYTGAANLWKALWGANSTDCKRFLGVTPLQDANHAVIPSPSEIMPRQELLTGPFAFRAQSAQYASEAKEDFTVGGNLTVNGTTTFSGTINAQSGTQSIGPIRASSSSVNLGNGYTSATSSNRASLPSSIYNVGQSLYFYSYYAMNFKPTAGNINFTVPSGYDMKVTGSGDFHFGRSRQHNRRHGGDDDQRWHNDDQRHGCDDDQRRHNDNQEQFLSKGRAFRYNCQRVGFYRQSFGCGQHDGYKNKNRRTRCPYSSPVEKCLKLRCFWSG